MSGPSAVGVALALAAAAQSALAVWVDRTPISGDVFRKVVEDRTKSHDIDGIAGFFHDAKDGPARVDHIVEVGSLASRVTSEISALVCGLAGSLFLVGIAIAANRGYGWTVATCVSSLVILATLVRLANRVRKGTLKNFVLARPIGGGMWDTPTPYVAIAVVSAAFTTFAGLVLG